jgi:hypothetical protein
MSGGVLVNGALVQIPGVTVVPPASHGGPSWALLDPGDYRARQGRVHLLLDHTTGGLWPQRVIPGAGPRGHAELIARMWSGRNRSDGQGEGKRVHSGAQVLIDFDGWIYCLVDLVRCEAFHAELANGVSVGVEHCTTHDGSIYQATIDASVTFHRELCSSRMLDVPYQVNAAPYRNAPLSRCEVGRKTSIHDGRIQSRCADLYGVLQHRDQTSERGRGDAGDALVAAHVAGGAEALDYSRDEDLSRGRARQEHLNAHGAHLVVDGLVGTASLTASRAQGYSQWSDVPA